MEQGYNKCPECSAIERGSKSRTSDMCSNCVENLKSNKGIQKQSILEALQLLEKVKIELKKLI